MASQLFSTFTEVGLVDTRSNAGTITLPKTIDIPYRQISLKDIYGNFQNKSLTLNTQFPDTFEDGTTSKVLTNAFGFTTLYAGPTNVWYTTGGTVLTSQTVSFLTVSTISGNGGYLTNLPAISSLSLQSTITGLGTTGYISTQSLVSTVTSLTYNYQTAGFISSANLATLVSTPFLNTSLTSTVAAITYAYQTAGFLSTPTLISTTAGITYNYQTAGFVSSANLATLVSTPFLNTSLTSTVAGLGQIYVSTVAAAISQSNLTSTIQGLGTIGYISSSQLTSTVAGLGQIYVSTVAAAISQSNLTSTIQGLGTVGYVSTTQVVSTVRGLGSSGYISSLSSFSTLLGLSMSISTLTTQYLFGTQAFISSLIVNSLSLGSNSAFIDMGDIIANSLSTTQINTNILYASSIFALNISGATTSLNLTSTVRGLGSSGYLSTSQLVSTVAGVTYGYQTSGFLSTPTLTSTVAGITYNYQTAGFISTPTIQSTTAGITYAYQTAGFLSSPTLISTVAGLGSATYISSPQLTSTTAGIYSFVNSFVDPTELTSTVVGLGTTGYVSTMGLLSTASGLASYITTFIDPNELASTVTGLGSASFVSTLQLTLNITSTVQGLGTVGYISSAQLLSTTRSYASYFTSLSASFSTITASNGYISSLRIDSLQIGPGDGWVDFGPLRAVAVSTLEVDTGSLYATSNFIGSVSSPFNAIQFYGLFGNFNNTVLAEVSTGAGTQELLLFKGSSSSDRIRLQTTGNIVFEPGSSARLWPSMSSNATPAMIINTSSNVGIQTASPQATLDVAGTGRFQAVSTLSLNISSINGQIYASATFTGSTISLSTASLFTSSVQASSISIGGGAFLSNTGLYLSNAQAGGAVGQLITNAGFVKLVAASGWSGGYTGFAITGGDLVNKIYMTAGPNAIGGQIAIGGTSPSPGSGISLDVFGIGRFSSISTFQTITSSIGIGTGLPLTPLDVAGTGRFQIASTLELDVSTINGFIPFQPSMLQSTIQGLGTSGYISTASLVSTFSASGSLFASTVQGLGTAGYVSTTQLTSTVAGLGQIYVSTVAAAISQSNLTSTVQGLGTLGYISSSQLTSTVAGLGQIYVSTVAAAISQSNLTSTIQGLGTIGYVSTAQVVSTVRGLGSSGYISSFSSFSTLFGLSTSISTLTSQYLYGTQGFISSLTVNSLILGATSGFIDLGDVIATTISTGQINATVIYASSIQASQISGAITSLNLVSTTAGITYTYQTAGYLSTPTLTSTTAGITYAYQTAGYLSSANLSGLVSTPFINTTLQSTITGLGTATYISSPQLTSTTAGIYSFVNSFVDPAELTSTVVGLGTTGYVSSMGLLSTASGLAAYITTFIDPVELASTVTGLGSASFVSTVQLTLNITSTVQGLGTVGYISSSQLTSTNRSYATYFTSLSASFSSITASNVYASTLTVDNLQIGTGLGWVNIGPIQTVALSTNQVQTGSLYATSNYIGSVSSPLNAIQFYGLFGQYNNTVLAEVSTGAGTQELLFFKGSSTSDRIRLQTTGNIVFEPGSSSRLWPSMSSNATPAMIINTSSNVGIQTVSPQATLDVAGTGRFQIASTLELDVSTINGFIPFQPSLLQSTVAGLGQIYVSTVAAAISQSNLTSTVQGLGTVGYISTASLVSTFSASGSLFASTVTGLGTAGYISTASLVSTFSASGSLFASTVRGLGSASYLSTSQLTSTVQGLGTFGYISSLINRTILSTLALNVSSINGAVPATNFVGSTLFLSATQALVSSQTNYNFSSVLGFISSLQVDELQIGSGYGTLVFGDTQMSSVSSLVVTAGLGQFVTLSSIFLNVSTINGTAPWQQSFLTSTTRGLGTLGYISTSQLTSTVAGLNTGGITQTNITSTVQGLGTVGYISTASLVSTFSASGSLFASTVAGLGSATYISSPQLTSTTAGIYTFVNSFVDPAELTSTVVGLGTTGYVSTMGLLSTASGLAAYITTFIDPAELASTVTGLGSASFVSTLQLNLNITSTVRGLGTAGYISTSQLISTGASYSNTFRSLSASFSSLTASNVFASTLTVDNLVIGSGLGWIDFPALRSPALSTIQLNAGSVYASSNFIGSVSSPFNAIQFYGLFGNYNNTVLAEVSTGAGTQELLLFKGSSSSDRIRLQTTGNIVFEPGSSARLWASNVTSNATPAMIINTSSNVGIQTASPQTTLDVAGTGRFQTVSTLSLNISSINGQSFGAPIQSTVIGLGSAGYVSTASLISTVSGSGSLFASTVRGLGSSGYISTSQLVSTVKSLESGGGGGWVGTATSDLDMNGYNITSVNGLEIETTAGSIYLSALPTPFYPLDIPSTAVIAIANDFFGVGFNSISLVATNYEDSISMSTGIVLNTSNSIEAYASTSINLYTPTVNRQLSPLTQIPQPVIQNGYYSNSSNASGSNTITLPYTYGNVNYKVFIQGAINSNDIPGVYTPVFYAEVLTENTFNVYWAGGSPANNTPYYWHTQGEYTPNGPAINLQGTLTGPDYSTTWDIGGGNPDSYVAYLQDSSNDVDWNNLSNSGDIYSNSWTFFGLTSDYYYRFYVRKNFPGPIAIESSNSASVYFPPV